MTASVAPLRTAPPRRAVRRDPIAGALAAAAIAGVVAVGIALAAASPGRRTSAASRVAIVVDAGGRPGAALASARAAAARGRPAVGVRVPRTGFEAAADVRYFAAQRYGTVVAVGPAARAAARLVAADYPRTRFVLPAGVP